MTHSRLNELMHAVLDGEATAVEARELDAVLARDAKAKDEFDELRWLFDGLAAVPQRFPPEGLVAAVTARLGELPAARTDADQLFAPSGVFGASSKDVRGGTPGNKAAVDRVFPLWAFFRGDTMSESTSGFSGKRKLLIGGGFAVAAVAVAVSTGLFPPSTDTVGTIVPADRYRAPQITSGDVKLDTQSAAQSTQNGASGAAASGNLPSGNLPSGNLPSGNLPSGNLPSGNLPSGNLPSGNLPSGNLPSGNLPSGNLPSGNLPSGNLPSGNLPSGNLPSGNLPSGHVPSGNLPSGNLPSGNLPSGNLPSGNLPSGNLPSGNLPSGHVPSGNLPSGNLPSGNLPSGNLPSGNLPNANVPSAVNK